MDDRLGTPTAEGQVRIQANNGATDVDDLSIESEDDSPIIERAEQATITQNLIMSYVEALNRISYTGRGMLQQDSFGNVTRVLSATVQRLKPNRARFSIVSEGVSFDSPPDEFSVVPVELGLNIIKHPRYFFAFEAGGPGTETYKRNQHVVRALQNYMDDSSPPLRNGIVTLIYNSLGSEAGSTSPAKMPGTDMAKRAALEIIQKFWRGEETPYVVGWQITWSAYYFRPEWLNPGGYIEDPITESSPQLPDYFWSPTFPPDPNYTIFDFMSAWNPQCYASDGYFGGPLSISWLRKADQMEYGRTWFKVDRTWIGSPVGHWDTELYSRGDGPQIPADYIQIKPEALIAV